MKLVKAYILLFIFGCSQMVSSQQLETMPCALQNDIFVDGEQLVYKLYYNWQFIWIPAGEVIFNVEETEQTYEVSITGTTYSSYDGFFKVRDYYSSSVDKETLQPIKFVRDIEEGNYIRYDSIHFDWETQTVIEHIGKTKEETKALYFSYEDCVQDMVSILYLLRNYDDGHIQPGLTLPISVFFDKEFYNLDIKVVDRGRKRIKGIGNKDVIQISPQIVTSEVFKDGNEMNIWVSDDNSKIPLMIESAVSVGSVKAVLISTKNTKDQFFD